MQSFFPLFNFNLISLCLHAGIPPPSNFNDVGRETNEIQIFFMCSHQIFTDLSDQAFHSSFHSCHKAHELKKESLVLFLFFPQQSPEVHCPCNVRKEALSLYFFPYFSPDLPSHFFVTITPSNQRVPNRCQLRQMLATPQTKPVRNHVTKAWPNSSTGHRPPLFILPHLPFIF